MESLGNTITYRQEKVKCGRPGCRRCPHGPYWYAYWRAGGKVKKKYIGKHRAQVGIVEEPVFQETTIPLSQREQDFRLLGVLVDTPFSGCREQMRSITVGLTERWRAAVGIEAKRPLAVELGEVRAAMKRLFPGRR